MKRTERLSALTKRLWSFAFIRDIRGRIIRVSLLRSAALAAGLFLLTACSQNASGPPNDHGAAQATSTSSATCAVIHAEPTLAPNAGSYFPEVTSADFSFGPSAAPVTLLEYCDFQSTGCHQMSLTVGSLMSNRSDVRFVFRPFPLIGVKGMDKTETAILAALAADKQGKFWTMYDLLFVNYDQWSSLSPAGFKDWILGAARAAGLDSNQLQTQMSAPETAARMTSMYDAAKKLVIPAVPLVLINGGLQPSYLLNYQSISDAVDLIALGSKQFSTCPPFNIAAAKQYQATIQTRKGNIIVQLFPDRAPLAVNSFVFLARAHWFDGLTFHRVLPGVLAQAGDPTASGRGNPGYFFKTEISDLKFDQPGRFAMANSGPDTNGSQFFITFTPQAHLDGLYTIFGQVVSGLEVAEQLTPRDPARSDNLNPGDVIIAVTIEEK